MRRTISSYGLRYLLLPLLGITLPTAAIAEHAAAPAARAVSEPPAPDGDVVMTDADDRRALSKALTLAREYKAESPAFSKALHSVIGASAVWHWTAANGCLNYRNEALELLDHSPTAWDAYEQMHGPAARTLLDEGNKQGDLRKVREVARRFAGTTAAREAQALLATYYVDRGHPLAAALLFEGLFASNRFKQGEARALPLAERSRRAFAYLAAATAFHQTGKTEARDHALQRAAALGSEDLAKRLLRDLGTAPDAKSLNAQRAAFVVGPPQPYLDALNCNTAPTRAIAVGTVERVSPHLKMTASAGTISDRAFFSGDAETECKFGSVGWPARLKELTATGLALDPALTGVLLRSLSSRALTSLDLGRNNLGDAGAKIVAEAPISKRLATLSLEWNDIDEAGIRAIAGSPHLKSLSDLQLGGNKFGDAGAKAIGESPHLKSLTTLYVNGCSLGKEGARALAESPNLRELLVLSMSGNEIGVDGAQAIGKSAHLGELRRLDLGGNEIDDDGVRAIAEAPHLKKLRSLALHDNDIGSDGARAIARSKGLGSLESLDLSENAIGRRGIVALAKSAYLRSLTELSLRGNRIGDTGARAIATSGALKKLANLSLGRCAIGEAGARALADSPTLGSLRYLDLSGNDVGEAGIRALIASPHLRNLTIFSWNIANEPPGLRADVEAFLTRNQTRLDNERK